MDTTDSEDPQVVQLAATAQARAEQSGYAAPPKSRRTHLRARPPAQARSLQATTAGVLNQDETLVSKNGKYEVEMQNDGNLVIYTGDRQAIWASGTAGKGTAPYKLAMQADGNLVIYGANGFVWDSGIIRPGTRRRTSSSCRMTAISASTTAPTVSFGIVAALADLSAGRRLAWAAVRLLPPHRQRLHLD